MCFKHEEYSDITLQNDLAILQLVDKIEPTSTVQFACLPYFTSNHYPDLSEDAWIVGWGRTSEGI